MSFTFEDWKRIELRKALKINFKKIENRKIHKITKLMPNFNRNLKLMIVLIHFIYSYNNIPILNKR